MRATFPFFPNTKSDLLSQPLTPHRAGSYAYQPGQDVFSTSSVFVRRDGNAQNSSAHGKIHQGKTTRPNKPEAGTRRASRSSPCPRDPARPSQPLLYQRQLRQIGQYQRETLPDSITTFPITASSSELASPCFRFSLLVIPEQKILHCRL